MKRIIGTSAFGLRAPIIKEGDNLVDIVSDVVKEAVDNGDIKLKEKDVLAVTESLLARSQGNYADMDDITEDLNRKYKDSIGVLFPITSRNRFSIILKAIAQTKKKIFLFLSYPSDEVGNRIIEDSILKEHKINIYQETIDEKRYKEIGAGKFVHPFTGVDYIAYYKNLAVDNNIEVFLSNDPLAVLNYTDEVLVANIHEREKLSSLLKENGAKTVYSLADILSEPINSSGYNKDYGLYGSNLSTQRSLKLFPRDAKAFAESLQAAVVDKTGSKIEVMVYGDGAFKDPIGKIWELADPVVSPGYTDGLKGTPNELKLKYIADTELKGLSQEEARERMIEKIGQKDKNTLEEDERLGTTPRKITDLLGSLCDLVSGSGDKGTPIVLIQGYFDNYASK